MNLQSTIKNLALGLLISLGINLARAGDSLRSAQQADLDCYPELAGLTRVYYVSPTGNDQNDGSVDHPFKSISQAAKILLPGEGVFVKAGTYRERVSPERGGEPGKPIVYFAEPGHQVYLKGSDLWQPTWTRVEKRIYSAVPDAAMFTDDAYWDSASPLQVTASATPWGREGQAEYLYFTATTKNNARDRMSKSDLDRLLAKCDTNLVFTLGQLFVEGKMFRQMPYRAEMEAVPESWFYDSRTREVIVHFADELAPQNLNVELTTRRRIFAPHHRGLGYIQVIGFVAEHCGNQYPKDFWAKRENGQAGAVGTRAGHHWLIRNNVIRFANGIGLDIGTEGKSNERRDDDESRRLPAGYHVIEGNLIADNGAGGICGSSPRAVRIVNNVLERNNNLRFKGTKRWESAGIKLHTPDDGVVADNLFWDNYTHGFWADQGIGKGLRFVRNVIIGNSESEHGVFIEMGEYGPDTGFIEDNIILNNRNGIYCHDGSGMTVAHNLIANSREYGIQVRQVGPRCNTRNNAFFDNLVVGNANPITLNYPAELGGWARLDGNIYSGNETDRVFVINPYSKFDPPWTDAQFAELVEANFAPKNLDKAALANAGSAKLTLDEWKVFWSKHSEASGGRSMMAPGATVQLDAAALELALVLPAKLTAANSGGSLTVTNDFYGRPYSTTDCAGPFANLVSGTNFIQLPRPGPKASGAVKVSINTKSPSVAIPADYTGLSFEVAQLLPDAEGVHYFRPDNAPLIQMFRTLGVRSLRVGGNTSDRDAKQLPDRSDWDALFAFARAAEVKVIYGLQLYRGDPQVASQTVKYLMDRYGPLIDSFAIGQEPSAYPVGAVDIRPANERMGAGAENFRYQRFADEWRKFAEEIRNAVPDVRFSGPDVHNDGKWTSQFIEDFGRDYGVSLITAHLYAGGAGNKVKSPQSGIEMMLSRDFAKTYRRLYDSFASLADSHALPYRLDELNNFYNGGAVGVSDTFAAALWGLDCMHWWAEHGANGLNFHTGDRVAAGPNLTSCRYAVFVSHPNGYQARPLAYALKAFELGSQGRFLPINIISPQSINLTAYAALDDEQLVYVTLINKEHGTQARDATVTLSSADGGFRAGQIIRLKSATRDATATSGETLGGSEISTTGEFVCHWTPLPALASASANDDFSVEVPAASAAIIRFTLNGPNDLNARR